MSEGDTDTHTHTHTHTHTQRNPQPGWVNQEEKVFGAEEAPQILVAAYG